jgi:serine/threonine protein kinase
LREAKAMARLAHPNVVPIHEIGTSEPLFIVMELVAGGTLRQWLAEPRPLADIIDAFEQAARGLAAAHAAGLVHRDFKPENVLRGGDGRVRVVDFGLVASREDAGAASPAVADDATLDLAKDVTLTHTGLVLGTPAYMAPEQHRGEPADARSDQFGFAVACYEALYGERPFAGTTYREMVRNVNAGAIRPAPADTSVPPAIRGVLERALSVSPEARFPSMAALLDALLAATSVAAPTATNPPAEQRQARRRWPLLALVGAVLVAGTAGTVAFLNQRPAPRSPATTAPASSPSPPRQDTQPAPVSATASPAPSPAPAPPAPAVLTPETRPPKKTAIWKAEKASDPISTTPAQPEVIDEAAERRRKQLELTE